MTKETFYKTVLVLFSVVFALLIGEAYSRISPKHLTYAERLLNRPYSSPFIPQESGWLHVRTPNSVFQEKKEEFNFITHSNSIGMSDREYNIDKPARSYRIAAFGDSYTEGIGTVPDSTWPRLLQYMLRQTNSDSVEVMNCGISGSDPLFEYIFVRDRTST